MIREIKLYMMNDLHQWCDTIPKFFIIDDGDSGSLNAQALTFFKKFKHENIIQSYDTLVLISTAICPITIILNDNSHS